MKLSGEEHGCAMRAADYHLFDPYSWLCRFSEAGGHLLVVSGEIVIGHDFSDDPAANSALFSLMREASAAPDGALPAAVWRLTGKFDGLIDIPDLFEPAEHVARRTA